MLVIESSYEVVERLNRFDWVGRAYTKPGFFVWHVNPPNEAADSALIPELLLASMLASRVIQPVYENRDYDEGELGESGEVIAYELRRGKDKHRPTFNPEPDDGVGLELEELLCG